MHSNTRTTPPLFKPSSLFFLFSAFDRNKLIHKYNSPLSVHNNVSMWTGLINPSGSLWFECDGNFWDFLYYVACNSHILCCKVLQPRNGFLQHFGKVLVVFKLIFKTELRKNKTSNCHTYIELSNTNSDHWGYLYLYLYQ